MESCSISCKNILKTKIHVSEKLKKYINAFIKLGYLWHEKSTFIKNKELVNFNNI